MFKKNEAPKNGDTRARSSSSRSSTGESGITIIGPGMHIRGDLTTDGTVRVEGTIDGTIRAGKSVILGKEGTINGDVLTQDAVIGGQLVGSIVAESRLELQSTCIVEGEIRARAEHLKLDEGARFNGAIQMDGGDSQHRIAEPSEAIEPSEQSRISPDLSTSSYNQPV